jgi:hypothetical protein
MEIPSTLELDIGIISTRTENIKSAEKPSNINSNIQKESRNNKMDKP